MKYKTLLNSLKEDLGRINTTNKINFFIYLRYLITNHSFKVSFYYRTTKYFKQKNKIIFIFLFIIYKKIKRKYGIQIPYQTTIGKGLQFPHYSCIVVNSEAIIGDFVTIFQGCTIGSVRGKGAPIIGDNCCFFCRFKNYRERENW